MSVLVVRSLGIGAWRVNERFKKGLSLEGLDHRGIDSDKKFVEMICHKIKAGLEGIWIGWGINENLQEN